VSYCANRALELLRRGTGLVDAVFRDGQRLLARGFLLGQAVERWHARAIWVVSRADSTYPQRLKARLREDAPPVQYGCGDRRLLESGGLAVLGSRNVDKSPIEYTEAIGRLAAAAGATLESGGARGIDQAAMRGALEAGGRVAGVL
jgi:predicted Rossmann fold nucleotide-binding protein DprA/Smf involved in DNA uptake